MLKELPYKRQGATVSLATPSGTAHITMNHDDLGEPFEVFVEIGKAGSSIKAMAESIGRLISLIFRLELIPPKERAKEIIDQLSGIGGARSVGFGKDKVLSLPDAISKAMKEHYELNDCGESGCTTAFRGEEQNQAQTPSSMLDAQCSMPVERVAKGEVARLPKQTEAITVSRQPSVNPQGFTASPQSLPRLNADICPICGQSSYVREEGCTHCLSCGHSEC